MMRSFGSLVRWFARTERTERTNEPNELAIFKAGTPERNPRFTTRAATTIDETA